MSEARTVAEDPLFSVRGQVALVSGASRGIGKAIARGFAERGALVVITGREMESLAETAKELSTAGDPVTPLVCDVADADSIRVMVDATLALHGRVDTLVNVAGVNRRKPATDVTLDDFDFIMDINLRGAFILSRTVGESMLARGAGAQINVSSLNNDKPLLDVLPYAVSKAGIGQMTRALASEWGPRGVRVNALAPGFVLTDLTKKLWSRPDMQAWGRDNTPLGRLGQPEDMVGAAIFLASSGASFLTGQILYVDGGFTAGFRWPIRQGDGT